MLVVKSVNRWFSPVFFPRRESTTMLQTKERRWGVKKNSSIGDGEREMFGVLVLRLDIVAVCRGHCGYRAM